MDILEYKEVKNFKIQTLKEVILLLNALDIKERPQTLNILDVFINCLFSSNSPQILREFK